MNRLLSQVDPEVAAILDAELERQQDTLILIASENYASKAVLQTQGCIMTNKYAEGYPGKRYYNGCKFMDKIEVLAIERAKKLFGVEHANVQPHAGSPSNAAAYSALLTPGDKILAMRLDHGGHLTHGLKLNFSGHTYDFVFYGVEQDTERFDLGRIAELAREHKPKLIIVGGSAYPREIDFAPWREIADEVGAYLMADVAHIVGLIAGRVHADPAPYCDVITTTTQKTLRGPRGGVIMCRQEFASQIDKAVFPGLQGGQMMHTIAAKAVCFQEAMEPDFRTYQAQIVQNAQTLADTLQANGFRLVSGGTDNHLMLVDLNNKDITGRDAANALEKAGITANKNVIPFDTRPATVTSGIRLGTPALTTRGMKEEEMQLVGEMITQVVHSPDDAKVRKRVRQQVQELCENFPIYEDLDLWS